ncbi:MAG: flagellar protein FlaG [Deltaproteobacteria bacterium]|nr:flagellar protein FlaG [Deltaproteobacteria bacterium]MBW2660913.1 flagellar protein FlaG [Deltaproteobacteria bacterium]
MDNITIDRIDAEPLKISETTMNKFVVSESLSKEENSEKASESEARDIVSNQQAKELTEKLQRFIDKMNINIAFSTYGEKNRKTAVTVSEKETGKLIREIPSEELQRLHTKMEELVGMLFNEII